MTAPDFSPSPSPALQALWARGAEFLGSPTAILAGAMSWVSERHLVSAISNAGGFGVIACSSMPPDILAAEIEATRALTDAPFGVNLIVMHPQLEELITVCKDHAVSHVVLAGGIPKATDVARIRDYGGKVLALPPSLAVAKRMLRMGVNALILEGSEAGGHIGPVALGVLAQEMLPVLGGEAPIFVAGGIGRGETIAAYLKMGASGAQLGTRFVCAEESIAHENFKKAFIRAQSRDATISVQIDPEFPVIPVRAIENAATAAFTRAQQEAIARFRQGLVTKQEAQLEIEHFWAGALRRAVIEGDIENGSVMAGQSLGLVKGIQPVAAIIGELIEQANGYLA